jgi:hypothetical protein
MESTLDSDIANAKPDPDETLADDERIAMIADELREAIRRKVSPVASSQESRPLRRIRRGWA